ncbi:MAG: hypothetical protein GY755_13385 [Chloroflexi bacterium]|nr:hypothetical protein [Chloroflexota bacterium]
MDEKKILVYVRESEDIDIKSALGDGLFLDLKTSPSNYFDLLNGGEYDYCGSKRTFVGIKKALAYYSFARIMKNGDYNVTRFGTTVKDSEYSSSAAYKEKVSAYNDAFSIADSYLKECVRYLNDNKDKFPLYKGKGGLKANRTVYKIIGE